MTYSAKSKMEDIILPDFKKCQETTVIKLMGGKGMRMNKQTNKREYSAQK